MRRQEGEGGVVASVAVALATLAGYHSRAGRAPPSERVHPEGRLGRALATCASHERLLLVYLVGLLLAVLGGEGHGRGRAVAVLTTMAILYLVGLVHVRTTRAPTFFTDRLGRLLVIGVILGSFMWLDVVLPAARGPRTLDGALLAFDLRVFHMEPAVLFDAVITPSRTEWFAFFYFSYFIIIASHVLPLILVERRSDVVGEMARGFVLVYGVGQLVYTIVPGFGPYATLEFAHPLVGTTWWPLVQASTATVNEASRTDIFPSLHTAAPLFLALFSFRRRALLPFRFTWPVLFAFSSQIILATMYLRWHYLLDVLVGVLLAFAADRYARGYAAEKAARAERGLAPAWRA